MARPKEHNLNGEDIQKLASYGCTNVEIADYFGCSENTIRRYGEFLTKGRSMKKLRLRQIQWKIAENGNAAMAIWLGKNELGQSDGGVMADDDQPLAWSVD
tara:strand:+ start:107 stop:409 length:303 start_codon:yes stop_codon:yes gene_type:complete